MKKLSIVSKAYQTEENVVGYYTTGDRVKYWGASGAFWGGIWGLLFGSAFFFVPGVGPLFVAGSLVAGIVSALESAAVVGGLSALGAALYSIGIPKKSILQYETSIKAGKFILVVHGTPDEVTRTSRFYPPRAHRTCSCIWLKLPRERLRSESTIARLPWMRLGRIATAVSLRARCSVQIVWPKAQ